MTRKCGCESRGQGGGHGEQGQRVVRLIMCSAAWRVRALVGTGRRVAIGRSNVEAELLFVSPAICVANKVG